VIIYLHGFRSGPESIKVQTLTARLAEHSLGEQLWCAQLSHVPFDAIQQVNEQIARCTTAPTLVGSSLGGFYATYLANKHGLQAALINPFVLHAGLDESLFLGEHETIYNKQRFCFTTAHIAQINCLDTPILKKPANFWLLAEQGDTVLDYRLAVNRYAGARQTVLAGGDHSFTRWNDYLDEIIAFAGLRA